MVQLGHLARFLGLLLSLLASPMVLVWPRAGARMLVPLPARVTVATRPRLWAGLIAGPLAVASALSGSSAVFGSMLHPQNLPHPAQALAILWLILGGLTFAAMHRAVRIGAREWAIHYGVAARTNATRSGTATPPAPSYATPNEFPIEQRPAGLASSRRLRGAATWLGAVGLAWYLFGRVLQATHLGTDSGSGSELPDWWWDGTVVLLVAGAAVWLIRRVVRRSAVRAAGPSPDLPDVLRAWGFQVSQPAGEWARSFAPAAFMSGRLVADPSLWPWAALSEVAGRTVLVTQQTAQVRNHTGLTSTRTRTVCAVEVAGARLPTVVVTGRESVPPQFRARSIDLELVTFNRSLWAWGPDPRGFHDVLHPRAMGPILRNLPDGASVRFEGDRIAILNDEPVRSTELAGYLELVHRLAELLPTYLVQR